MKKIIIYILLLIIVKYAFCTPSWYNSEDNTEYSNYLIGKGIAPINKADKAESINKAKTDALKNLTELLSSKVVSETITKQSENVQNNVANSQDCFISTTQIESSLEFINAQILKSDKDNNYYYILIGIPKNDLKLFIKNRIQENLIFSKSAMQKTDKDLALIDKNDINLIEQAVLKTKQSMDLFKIYLLLNNWNNDLKYLWDESPKLAELSYSMEKLQSERAKDTSDIAEELCKNLNLPNNSKVLVFPAEYDNTQFISDFGKNLKEMIAYTLKKKYKVVIVDNPEKDSLNYICRTRIIETGNNFHVFLSMTDKHTNKEISSQSLLNSLTIQKLGREYILPKNYKQILDDKIQIYNSLQKDNKLIVELQTDKMFDGPITYTFGEKPKILVRANKACYLRLIYIFSDGSKTLLLDNYYLGNLKVNQWVDLGLDLEICGPEGTEQLLLQASSTEMPLLKINRTELDESHIDYIQESEFSDQIAKTRGIKIKNPKNEITETSYQWTIFEK